MKRTAKKIIVAAVIAAISTQSVSTAAACGGRGGRSSYSPVYGSYGRAASNYRATLPATPPIRYSQPACSSTGPAPVVSRHAPPTTVAGVQPRPRDQVARRTAQSGQPALASAQQSNPLVAQQAGASAARQNLAQGNVPSQKPSAPQNTKPATAAADAESSALAALASIAANSAEPAATQAPASTASQVPQFTSASSQTAAASPSHVGVFQAKLPSDVTIELRLEGDNKFSWIVRRQGKTSRFEGQYLVSEGRLTLVRSNDLQQMAGTMTNAQNGFTFKLDGGNNAGLEFQRV